MERIYEVQCNCGKLTYMYMILGELIYIISPNITSFIIYVYQLYINEISIIRNIFF